MACIVDFGESDWVIRIAPVERNLSVCLPSPVWLFRYRWTERAGSWAASTLACVRGPLFWTRFLAKRLED